MTSRRARVQSALKAFLSGSETGGLLLMATAAAAMIVANSPLAPTYFHALETKLGPLSLLHWINDGLMAVFFLLVGLEIKREALVGQIDTWPRRALPGIAAVGGMAAPAIVYVAINWQSPENLRGWAIPTATDIAFSLAVLSLVASRVPTALKVFLTALAIIDDLGAVLIIALFYTDDLSLPMLGLAAALLFVLAVMNKMRVGVLTPYIVVGIALWICLLSSGVHATLAGVFLALTIPLRMPEGGGDERPPLHRLEHGLAPWVAFLVVPIFGFANAGVSFAGLTLSDFLTPLPLGILAGLFIGKQLGITGAIWLAVRTGLAEFPPNTTWIQIYGVALLCGIGFTMSLFIGLLAFTEPLQINEMKLGVFAGSIISALLGWVVLWSASPRPVKAARRAD